MVTSMQIQINLVRSSLHDETPCDPRILKLDFKVRKGQRGFQKSLNHDHIL